MVAYEDADEDADNRVADEEDVDAKGDESADVDAGVVADEDADDVVGESCSSPGQPRQSAVIEVVAQSTSLLTRII